MGEVISCCLSEKKIKREESHRIIRTTFVSKVAQMELCRIKNLSAERVTICEECEITISNTYKLSFIEHNRSFPIPVTSKNIF